MKLAIVHYHLNRGGVAQVIVNHLRALNVAAEGDSPSRIALIHGGRSEDWPEELEGQLSELSITRHAVPELEYDSDPRPKPASERLAYALQSTLGSIGFAPDDTVLQIHNPTLGKNVSLPGAIARLARDGYAMLLQIHDFAEDFRPENYRRLTSAFADEDGGRLSEMLYPQASHIHYAVLNGRDRGVLARAGVPPERLHLLPNPVAEFESLPDRGTARDKIAAAARALGDSPLVLYPVRGIRRKNLGEVLLWSLFVDRPAQVGITLPPLNPVEHRSYAAWKQLAGELALPCLFEMGQVRGVSFLDNLAAADAVLTTSVAEGFGMVFLESWLADRPLIGRDLPEITADFVAAGVRLDDLYVRLAVPLAWIGWRDLVQTLRPSYEAVLEAFGGAVPPTSDFEAELHRLIVDDSVDFAALPVALQRRVLHHVRDQVSAREQLLSINGPLAEAIGRIGAADDDRVQQNAAAVRAGFSLHASGMRLRELFAACLRSERGATIEPPAHGSRVLESFLSLSRFQPLRIEVT